MTITQTLRVQELCESRGGRPGFPSLISLRFLWTQSNTSTNQHKHNVQRHSVTYICRSSVLTALFSCYMAEATWNCCRLDASSACTIQPCTSLQCHFISSHIRRVHVCLAVTYHMHFWHTDRDGLRATAVTRGRNRYRYKSQLRI